MNVINAGFAKVDITPELPVRTLYTICPENMANTITSRLYVKTSVFQSTNEKMALISADLLGLDSIFLDNIKSGLRLNGFDPDKVMIACTHTHAAPNTMNFNGSNGLLKKEDAYLKSLEKKIIRSVIEALEDLEPAELFPAKKRVDVNVNRREIGRIDKVNDLKSPTGLVDNELGMLFIRRKKTGEKAVLLNYTAHPLAMGKKNVGTISADFPGALCEYLEEKEYKFVQFFQGAAGNVNVKIAGGKESCRKAARLLADTVLEKEPSFAPMDSASLKMVTRKVHMPVDNLQKLLEKNNSSVPDDVDNEWRTKAGKLDASAKTYPVIIQTIQIGDMVMAVLPGEQFVETGLEIKKESGQEFCFITAYANCGEIGYVPTKKAFPEGGYEVDEAYKYYGDIVYRSSPDASRFYIKEALTLIRD